MNCGYKQFVVRRRYTNFCGRKTDITIPLLNNSIKGNSRIKTAKIFQVHYETIGERVKKYKETGEIKDREFKRKPKKIDPEKLEKYIEEHPDAYLREIAQVFNCTPVAVHNRLKKLGITRKKTKSLQGTRRTKSRGIP